MIKFFCDSCGGDISQKVYDSVRQFCGKDHFEQNMLTGMTRDDPGQLADVDHEIDHCGGPLCLEIQLLRELSKLIHASAWGWSSRTMRCGHCSTKNQEVEKKRVITLFTRIHENQMVPEAG